MSLVLAYDTLKDPRDLAEVIHLASGFGAELCLLGSSLEPTHWKVLRKLRSWRPDLTARPEAIARARFDGVRTWAEAMRARGLPIAGTVIQGGTAPWASRLLRAPRPAGLAVLFGEETHGLAPESLGLCDELWTLPLGEGGKFYTVGQATAVIVGATLVGLTTIARGGTLPRP